MPEAAASALYRRAPKSRWFRRDGEFLVVRTGAVLPARCVRSNEPLPPGDWMRDKQLVWRPWGVKALEPLLWVALALVFWKPLPAWVDPLRFMVPLLGVVFIARQKSVKLTYFLYRRDRRRRLTGQIAAGLVGIAGLLLLQPEGGWRDGVAALLFMGGVFASNYYFLRFPLRAVRHENGEFWLKGASPEFLDSLASSSPDR